MYWNEIEGDHDRLGCHEQPLNVRTVADLNAALLSKLSTFENVDCIVGVPRSGLLVATILALQLNVPFVHVHDFLIGNMEQSYTRRKGQKHHLIDAGTHQFAKVLVVDDATGNGVTFGDIRSRMAARGRDRTFDIKYMAAYCTPSGAQHVDHFLEIVPFPRVFEWNLIHHANAKYYCIDLDGVLCDDPTEEENDDGKKYEKFCLNARPKLIPTAPVGAIVTARLERFRPQTEQWLRQHHVSYERLVMCNIETGAERRRLNAHAQLKADAYKKLGGMLFVESDLGQAKFIQVNTGKPVFCFGHGLVEG